MGVPDHYRQARLYQYLPRFGKNPRQGPTQVHPGIGVFAARGDLRAYWKRVQRGLWLFPSPRVMSETRWKTTIP